MKGKGKGKGGGMPRKPIEQHIAEGTYRADRHATWKNPIESLSSDLSPMQYMSDESKEVWNEIVESLPENTLHRLDRHNLERYSRTLTKWREVMKCLDMCDPLDKSHYGLVQQSIMLNKSLESLGDLLGMNKQARDKIIREADKPKTDNPFKIIADSVFGTVG